MSRAHPSHRSTATRLLAAACITAASGAGCVKVSPNAVPLPAQKGAAPAGAQQGGGAAAAPGAQQAGGGPASAAAGAAARRPDEKGPFAPWDTVLKDTRAIDGYFKTYLKRDNTLFLELRPDQFEKEFGLVMHRSRGVGDFDLHRGLPLSDTHLLRFRRVGDKVMLVRMNPRFTAAAGSPMLESAEGNVGNSIVAALKIESEHKDSKALLVNMTPFLVSDYADQGAWFRLVFERKPVGLDQNRSYVGKVMGFPKNLEIDAELTFQMGEEPPGGAITLSDYRSIPVGVRYSFFALPERPLTPRLGDERVGHFMDAVRDFSRDRKESDYVRFVNRWRLEKKNHNVPLSEPVQPIVYYIDRSVPMEYRQYVKEGIEAWNKAFEAAGFKNAIVAREAPADSTWSAEDIRYSTVRWTAAHRMGYAIGPSQTDPRTGEILNADVLISREFVRGWVRDWQEMAGPESMTGMQQLKSVPGGPEAGIFYAMQSEQRLRELLPPSIAQRVCIAALGKAHQMNVQFAMLAGMGVLAPGQPVPESYIGDALRDLIMHEVGHTLGLRHNFKASSAIPYDRMNDTAYTRKHGLTLSVMEYGAVNVSPDPSKQGHFVNTEVGDYDVWAIKYAYAPVYEEAGDGKEPRYAAFGTPVTTTMAEERSLRRIAAEAAEPMHAFATDEDTHLGSWSVDPLSSTWDISSDPLRFATDRATIVRRVVPKLESRLIAEGEGYNRMRIALGALMSERLSAMLPVTKTVGGMYTARDHKGDPKGRAPFTPVPAAKQREAVKLIVDNAFDEDAFKFEPEVLNKLAPNRWSDWSTGFTMNLDYPVHDIVVAHQSVLVNELLHPQRLRRMLDNSVRMPRGTESYTAGEMFQTLTKAIWSELGDGSRPREVASFRRNLQRVYAERLTDLLVSTRLQPSEDARSLARLELSELSAALGRAATPARALDRETRAHFAESKARIDRALAASLSVPTRP